MTLPVNFADKVQPSTCLAWTGAVQSSGYGSVGIGNGKTGLAHRVAWEHARGPIPERRRTPQPRKGQARGLTA